jgi:hypothetical protein
VNASRHELLPGATLAGDEDRGFGGRDLANQDLDAFDEGVLPNQQSMSIRHDQVAKK